MCGQGGLWRLQSLCSEGGLRCVQSMRRFSMWRLQSV